MPFIATAIAAAFVYVGASAAFAAAAGAIISQAIIGAGIAVASGFLLQKLLGKPQSEPPGGVQLDHRYGVDIPRQVAIGSVGIAGHDCFFCTFNPANRDYLQVFVLSDYYTTELTRVAVNGKWVTLGAPDGLGYRPVTDVPWGAQGLLSVKYYDGRQTTHDGLLEFGSQGRWATTNVGKGVSYVIVYSSYHKDDNNSFPDMFFEFKGAPLYDWRKDSTNGGSGAHRFDDPTTHEYSENPILAEYNYRRGFSIQDDLFCGMDMPASDLPVAKFTTAANICDELNIDGDPRYRVSVLFSSMSTHGDNIKACALACGAMQIDQIDGSWPLVGSAQVSEMTFTDDDIISTAGNFRYSARVSMSELVNSVTGTYPSPANIWSTLPYEPQIDDTYVVLDRRTRDVSIDFPQVPYSRQAAELANIYLYENRFEASATVMLRPRFQVLEVGDWVDWDSDRYGLKTYIITNKVLMSLESEGPRNVVLSLKERDASIYDGTTPPAPDVPDGNPVPAYRDEVDNFAVLPTSVLGTNGRAHPALRVSWNLIDDDVTITHVELVWYPSAQPSAAMYKTVTAETLVNILSEGVVSNTLYKVQARIITDPPRTTVFNSGAEATTYDIKVGTIDIDAAITYQVVQLQDAFDERIALLENTLSSYIADQDSRNWLDKKEIRTQLTARTDAAFAEIEEVRLVAVDADAAFASYSLLLTAEYGSANASVSAISSSIATLDGYAASQWSITLNVNGFISGIELVNGGSGSSAFTVVADKFEIQLPGYNGDAPQSVFATGLVGGVAAIGIDGDLFLDGTFHARAIIAGTITGTMILAGAISTTQLAVNGVDIVNLIAGAATAQSQTTHASSSMNSLTPLQLGSNIVMDIKGGTAQIMWSASFIAFTNTSGFVTENFVADLMVDGVTVKQFVWAVAPSSPFTGTPVTVQWDANGLSNASHTFQLKLHFTTTGGAQFSALWGAGQFTVRDLRK